MSYDYETDTRAAAHDESAVVTSPAVRVRRGGRDLIQKILLAAIGSLVVLAALVFLILTIRSQTTRPSGDKSVEKSASTPKPAASPGTQPSLPGVAAPIVDEDGDGIDDGVEPNVEIPQPNLREPATTAPPANQYTGPYLNPRTAPGTVALPAGPQAPVVTPPAVETQTTTQPTVGPQPRRTEEPATPAPAASEHSTPPPAVREKPRAAREGQGEVRRMADKTFRLESDGTWVDVAFDPTKQLRVVEVVAGSGEYMRLLAAERRLSAYFRLSDQLVVVLADTVYRVVPKAK